MAKPGLCFTYPACSMTVFLADAETTAQKVAIGDAVHHLEADVRLARGRGGGETPPAPITPGVLYFVAGFSLIQAQAWHKPSKNQKKGAAAMRQSQRFGLTEAAYLS